MLHTWLLHLAAEHIPVARPGLPSLHVLQKYDVHNDHCAQGPGDYAGQASCREFLERAGGPGCGPGHGGVTCGDRLATVILYLR